MGDAGCHCAIERGVIDARRNPESVEAFCLGEYTTCPTWRAERKRIDDHVTTELVDRDADIRAKARFTKMAIAARRDRARELMESDTEEGRKFRARIASIIDGRSPVARGR